MENRVLDDSLQGKSRLWFDNNAHACEGGKHLRLSLQIGSLVGAIAAARKIMAD